MTTNTDSSNAISIKFSRGEEPMLQLLEEWPLKTVLQIVRQLFPTRLFKETSYYSAWGLSKSIIEEHQASVIAVATHKAVKCMSRLFLSSTSSSTGKREKTFSSWHWESKYLDKRRFCSRTQATWNKTKIKISSIKDQGERYHPWSWFENFQHCQKQDVWSKECIHHPSGEVQYVFPKVPWFTLCQSFDEFEASRF